MKFIIVFLCVVITSCVWAKSEAKLDIHGVQVADDKLRILVTSTGCTSAASFQLHWQNNTLNIVRIKSDGCRRVPHRIWVDIALPQNMQEFTLVNNITI